jgi:hypothetical protein
MVNLMSKVVAGRIQDAIAQDLEILIANRFSILREDVIKNCPSVDPTQVETDREEITKLVVSGVKKSLTQDIEDLTRQVINHLTRK